MLVKVVLVAVLSSVGMSGVPGGGYIGEYIMCSIFFPDHMDLAFPILVTIGNLVDPPATMINSSGDYVVSFIVSRFVDGKDWLQKGIGGEKIISVVPARKWCCRCAPSTAAPPGVPFPVNAGWRDGP